MRGTVLLITILLCLSPCGCGSKISEANYYRVQYGMSEEDVEDLLGPSHAESLEAAAPASSSASATTLPARVVKTWSRGALAIHVAFESGSVTGRSAEGIAAEANWSCATRPTSYSSSPAD